MRFAFVQHDIAWEDKAANHACVERMLCGTDDVSGSYVVLPEMGDTGFSFNLERTADGATEPWAARTAARFGAFLQAGFVRRGPDGRGRNCAGVFSPAGAPLGTYEKVHPFSFSRETEYFSGGDQLLLIDTGVAVVAPMICYDLRFPELWRVASREGAEVFTIGASWPAARQQHWRALVIARAIENQAFIVAVNRVGRDPHLAYAGGSLIVSPKGEVLAEAKDAPCIVASDLDLEGLRAWRREFPALKDVRPGLLGSMDIRRSAVGSRP